MESFAFRAGQLAARQRAKTQEEQVEPVASGQHLEDWRRGYGGAGKPCPKKSIVASAVDSAASVPSQCRAARGSPTGSVHVAAAPAKPKQATLFEIPQDDRPKAAQAKAKPAPSVPVDEIQDEIDLLLRIGIGLTEAERLVRKERWTLDQIVCQLFTGNEAKLSQQVLDCVSRYAVERGWIEAA